MIKKLLKMRSFFSREDGTATLEFAILFPAFIAILVHGYEVGHFMIRDVMLERAVDMAVRDTDTLKAAICEQVMVVPDCMNKIRVELQPAPTGKNALREFAQVPTCNDVNMTPPEEGEDQADASDDDDPMFDRGTDNQLMLVRVCVLEDPMFPTTAMGIGMKKTENGATVPELGYCKGYFEDTGGTKDCPIYAMVATTAFVNEPR